MQELITFFSHHLLLSIATAVVLVLVMLLELARAKRKQADLTPTQATQLINHENAVMIDLRSSEHYRNGHIIHAESIPSQEIKAANKKLEKWRSRPFIFVCSTGLESQKVAADLRKQGYNAHALAGGMRAWTAAQMPTIKE